MPRCDPGQGCHWPVVAERSAGRTVRRQWNLYWSNCSEFLRSPCIRRYAESRASTDLPEGFGSAPHERLKGGDRTWCKLPSRSEGKTLLADRKSTRLNSSHT